MTRNITRTITATLVMVAGVACGNDRVADETARPIELAPARQDPPALADAPVATPEPIKAPAKRADPPRVAPPLVAQPQPEPQAGTPAPVAAAPAVAAPAAAEPTPPAPTTGTVDAGTAFSVKPSERICTNTHRAGDRFTATLGGALRGTNGAAIPEGAVATLRIVDGAGQSRTDSAHLIYDLLSIRSGDETYEVNARVTQSAPIERANTLSRTDAAKRVGTGAVIGAIAGRVLGGSSKGAVVGGAIGAAAGAAVAVSDNKVEGCLRGDGTITLVLEKPLTIRLR